MLQIKDGDGNRPYSSVLSKHDEEINLRRYHPVSSGFEIISSRRPQKSRPGAGHKNGRRDDDDDDDGSLFKIELTD